ncbi:PREDICTED: dynein heavy chain 6, axonemal-like, partial [Rhagoletis zephyria]|uniref:dynein heavy chain 6, axonemal-like n=1 Tax=Rhagoletis zephyria TaxID=28612 RepID=UPI0008118636
LAAEEVDRITQEAHDFIGIISAEPETTLEIVEHIRELERIDENLNKLFEAVDYAHDLYMIIKEFEIPCDDERREDYMDCEDLVNRGSELLKETQARRPDFINQLNQRMLADIDVLREEIHDIALGVQISELLDINTGSKKAKGILDDLNQRLSACKERVEEYIGYQKEFKIDISQFLEMDDTFLEIRMRNNLWQSLDEWDAALDSWVNMEFNQLNVEEMNNLNMKIIKNCLQFEKYLPENNIVPKMKSSADEFRAKLPVIGFLRNPHFKA